jgi:hypothetical protein
MTTPLFIVALFLGASISRAIEAIYQGFDFDGHTGHKLVFWVVMAWSTFFLSGCVTPPHSSAAYPAIHILPVLAGDKGYHLDDDNYQLAVFEGVPENLFVTDTRGHYLSREAFIEASEILDQKANPMPVTDTSKVKP